MGRAAAVTRYVDADPIALEYAWRQRQQAKTFRGWLGHCSPHFRWDYPHLEIIRSALDRAAMTVGIQQPGVEGEPIRRLAISIPPQHGKSSLSTVRWPLWLVIRNPTLRVLMASYNEDKATEFSRDSRKLAAKWVSFADDVNRVGEWQTTAGGGVFAAGIGGGATGRPFDVIVIDDPFKDRADADSLQRRETVWSWYTEVALTRRPKVVVIIATRWHEDDLTGRILSRTATAGWESINLPALSEGEGDPLGRPYGEALCPEMMSQEALEEQRELNPFSFSALYQGSPTVKEGAMCLVDRILEFDPDALPPELPRVRCWDIAASSNPKADQTAGVLIVGPDSEGTFYVSDVIAGHWEPSERNAKILEVAGDDGAGVPIWGPEDPGPHGKESAQAFVRLLEGYSVVTSPVLKRQGARPDSKALRAEPWIAQINGGHVRIPKGAAWAAAFLDQHRKFPHGRRDDMVDACALGMAALRHSRPPGDFGIF